MLHRILIVLTSHDRLGDTGRRTGYWLEELATPYYVFRDAGAAVTLASPGGGLPPLDPESTLEEHQSRATRRFAADTDAMERLMSTVPLRDVRTTLFDAVFYPGGHGPLWDLIDDPNSVALIESFDRAGKPVAAVCHGPVVFLNARQTGGSPLVSGRRVTSFSNAEETAIGLADAVPSLLENELRAAGGIYSSAEPFAAHVVQDGHIITGQNPASSEELAHRVLASCKELAA